MHDTTSTPAAHEMRLQTDARQRLTRRLWLVAAAVALAACGEGDPDRAAAVTTDSAGVEIVEISGALDIDSAGWRVASDEAVRIGLTDGTEPYLFSGIAGVARLSDGSIVVSDRGHDEIRFYDPAGSFVRSVGGSGDGPTEFRSIVLMTGFSRDSLLVVDRGGTRVTVLDDEGTHARRGPTVASDEGGPLPAWAVFGNGAYLVMPTGRFAQVAPGVMEHESTFRRIPAGGAPAVDYPAAMQSVRMFAASAGEARQDPGPPPAQWAVGPERFHYAPDPRRFEIWSYAADGSLERIVRWGEPSSGALSGGQTDGRWIRSLVADAAGRTWVQVSDATEDPDAGARWVVLDEGGIPRHVVDLPPISRGLSARPVLEIGEDYVLLATTNDLDVPVVLLLPLIEAPAH